MPSSLPKELIQSFFQAELASTSSKNVLPLLSQETKQPAVASDGPPGLLEPLVHSSGSSSEPSPASISSSAQPSPESTPEPAPKPSRKPRPPKISAIWDFKQDTRVSQDLRTHPPLHPLNISEQTLTKHFYCEMPSGNCRWIIESALP
jgi:hypothetical protein